MKYKINDKVQFKANSIDGGKVISLPDEDTNMYSIETVSGNVIRCKEHYIEKKR